MRRALYVLVLAGVVLTTIGCSLDFIKRRLPPPTRQGDGTILFVFEAPSAQMVQLAGNWPDNDWLRGQAQTGSFMVGKMEDEDRDGARGLPRRGQG